MDKTTTLIFIGCFFVVSATQKPLDDTVTSFYKEHGTFHEEVTRDYDVPNGNPRDDNTFSDENDQCAPFTTTLVPEFYKVKAYEIPWIFIISFTFVCFVVACIYLIYLLKRERIICRGNPPEETEISKRNESLDISAPEETEDQSEDESLYSFPVPLTGLTSLSGNNVPTTSL